MSRAHLVSRRLLLWFVDPGQIHINHPEIK